MYRIQTKLNCGHLQQSIPLFSPHLLPGKRDVNSKLIFFLDLEDIHFKIIQQNKS